MIPRTYRLPGAGCFVLALSPAAGRHFHSIVETAALQGTSAKIEREREKPCHEIFLLGQDVRNWCVGLLQAYCHAWPEKNKPVGHTHNA